MLDIAWIRENLDRAKEGVSAKGHKADWDKLLELDGRRRKLLTEVEALKAEKNKASEEVSQLKRQKQDAAPVIERMRLVGERIDGLDKEVQQVETQIHEMLLRIPNVPHADVPRAADASGNKVVRTWGEPMKFAFAPKPHDALGEALDILDIPRGAKVAGSDFYFLKGAGAALERACINFMMDLHARRHGYREILPPYLANRPSGMACGYLPVIKEEVMYRVESDDLFLIPTAEVPVTNLHRDEILPAEQLPVKYVAFSACFRREAGAAGRQTKGIIRVHQFNKVELVKFVRPETSYAELESLTANAEAVLQALKLPYRVLLLCTGDMSFASAKTYDLELWAPGSNLWLEVSSCSNFETYQARRAQIRFKEKGGKAQLVHTLNGSGVALPRLVVAILENYQQPDGTIRVPDALRPYMGGLEVISK